MLHGLVALGCMSFAACGDGDPGGGSTGTLVVPFQLGNKQPCDALGVVKVRAELNDREHTTVAQCSNGQVRFVEVPAGTYKIQMYGLDDDNVEIMDSVAFGEASVDVAGNDQTSVSKTIVTLTAAPAHLYVRWGFGFGTCRGAGVDSFVIDVWRAGGANRVIGQTMECTLEGEGADQYREIADPDRRLSGDEGGEVSVQPLDRNKYEYGKAVIFKYKAPGPGHDIRVTVNCDGDGGCSGTGRPD